MIGASGRGDGQNGGDDSTPGVGPGLAFRAEGWREGLGDVLRAHLGIDARALAAFRIGLGAVLLLDLALRARYLGEFYTDAGILPRSAMIELYPITEHLSLHGQFGGVGMQAVLFAVAGVVALALLVGYRTTPATLLSLGLLLSLHGRNPLVLNGGDILLRHLLLWAVFLPLGERWSVDATRRSRRPRDRIVSVATAGLLLQVVAVYAVNAVLKHQGTLWQEGTAIRYVFGLDQFTVLLGDALAETPWLLSVLGRVWLWMLTVSWLLVVLRGWPRAALALAFASAHASMALTMQLGLFPLVSVLALLVFLPTAVWDALEYRVVAPLSRWITTYRPERRRLSRPSLPAALDLGGVRVAWRGYVVPGVAALVLVVLLVNNVGAVTQGDLGPLSATDLTAGDSRWSMFAPEPPQSGHWYALVATLEGGERVDAVNGGPPSLDRPPDLADTYPTARWRKYLGHVGGHEQSPMLRRDLSDHACRDFARSHDGEVASVTIVRFTEPVVLDGENPIHEERFGPYRCGAR